MKTKKDYKIYYRDHGVIKIADVKNTFRSVDDILADLKIREKQVIIIEFFVGGKLIFTY